jgi:serine/threonine protein kinase
MGLSERYSSLVALDTGTILGGYRIEAVLGHGSMGTVYSALDVALERRVALKVLTPDLHRASPGTRRRPHLRTGLRSRERVSSSPASD